ncbi:heterokaryon incompatibility protein-domain-containing protein [Mariannaea sp. PMI_226]|nr:heterokaryon incompatibility protein-domain-containing protein [Mariannaea sp. PMI_226]
MRLLNTETLRLESFVGPAPRYAVLSHRWGDAELLFDEAVCDGWQHRVFTQGAEKIKKACAQALYDGIDYIWADTCCLDRSSSAELSEAINAMFVWYQEAAVSYAYLSDVDMDDKYAFALSQWFERGWTLQELIAPEVVVFYDATWRYIGNRDSMASLISEITSINQPILARKKYVETNSRGSVQRQSRHQTAYRLRSMLRSYSVAARLSWAAARKTTRVEDMAYCLLGLFDINMQILYGEGKKAFHRLFLEIIRHTEDPSILISWTTAGNLSAGMSFYRDPTHYADSGGIGWLKAKGAASSKVSVTNPQTLSIEALLCPCVVHAAGDSSTDDHFVVAIIDCHFDRDQSRVGIVLRRQGVDEVFEQYQGLPFAQLEAHSQGKVIGSMPNLTCTKISFVEKEAQPGSIQVALTERSASVQRNPRLCVTPLVQPPTLHYTIGTKDLVSDEKCIRDGDVGVFVVENELSQGFFLIWGYSNLDEDDEAADKGMINNDRRTPKPWCRILPWKKSPTSVPKKVLSLQGEPDIFVLDHDPVELFSARETFVDMMERFRKKRSDGQVVDLGDIVVLAMFRPKTFLGYTQYNLVVEIEPSRTAVGRTSLGATSMTKNEWRRKRTTWERFSPPHLMVIAKKKAIEWL